MQLSHLMAIWVRSVSCTEVVSTTASTDVEALLSAEHGRFIQQVLVDQLGALEAVWVNEAQREVLLGLPLPAMQMLLASGHLKLCVVLLGNGWGVSPGLLSNPLAWPQPQPPPPPP